MGWKGTLATPVPLSAARNMVRPKSEGDAGEKDRSLPVRELLQKLGGQLVGFYFCFGEYDVVALFEAPDDSTATALALAVTSPGHLKAYKTTKLFTVEETMEAMRKGGSLTFQGPSRG